MYVNIFEWQEKERERSRDSPSVSLMHKCSQLLGWSQIITAAWLVVPVTETQVAESLTAASQDVN